MSRIIEAKKNGISWITGTNPTVPVMFGFGVNPAWATVLPVVRLAIVAKRDEAKTMRIRAPTRSPTMPPLDTDLLILISSVWKMWE